MARLKPKPTKPPTISVCILAGGLSTRMGRDKSRIRIGRRTMLEHVRHIASELGLPVRVLRRDAVPRCGPIGGIYTALARTRADAILFLACDMPFVTAAFLNEMLREFRVINPISAKRATSFAPIRGEGARGADEGAALISQELAKALRLTSSHPLPMGEGRGEGEGTVSQTTIFASHQNLFGLPCLIPRESLRIISRQIAKSRFSLQSLARSLKARPLTPARQPALQLLNLNTPKDLESARQRAVPETGAPTAARL